MLPSPIYARYPCLLDKGASVTIGIGVLGCSKEPLETGKRPDTIIMVADTMGSTPEDSTDGKRVN
jgi:hypothetical protein